MFTLSTFSARRKTKKMLEKIIKNWFIIYVIIILCVRIVVVVVK